MFILRVRCSSGTLFLDIRREVYLVGLKSSNQLSAQWCIVPKSELRVSAAVLGFSTIIQRIVSSRGGFDWMLLTISLIKIRKSGLIIEPCGTPAKIEAPSLISFHL